MATRMKGGTTNQIKRKVVARVPEFQALGGTIVNMEAKQDPKTGVITLKITPSTSPKPSASGKSMTLFTTGGLDKHTDLPEGYYVNLTIGKTA